MSKEPGQLAYEVWSPDGYPWENTPHKARWAAVEAAVRADATRELVEALEDVVTRITEAFPASESFPPIIRARAALEKARKS
jgi:hypothetical protein